MIWNKILPKYAIEMCQIMKIGQIVVLYGHSDTRLTVPARKPSPSSNEYLDLVSVYLNGMEGTTKHILNYIWAIISQNNNVQAI